MIEILKDFLFGPVPERSQEPRIAAVDGTVQIDADTLQIKNWSSRGFLATSCVIERGVTEGLDIRFRARLGRQRLDVACRTIVVRIDADRRELAGRFAKMDDAAMCEIAQHFATGAAG